MNRDKILQYAYWVALLITALIGLWAFVIRATGGMRTTNLNSLVPWGLWVAFYIYFIGLSAGSFLLSTLIYVFGVKRFEAIGRTAVFSATIALGAGLLFILLDLGHMERFWTVFVNRSASSVLEWEIHFYILYMVILVAELWLLMRRDLIRQGQGTDLKATIARVLAFGSKDTSAESAKQDMRWVKLLGILGVPVAIGVHGGTGAIFAVVKARPYWYTGLFPIIFLVSALASGGALLLFITAYFTRQRDEAHRSLVIDLSKLVAGFLALDLILLTSELLVGLYGAVPDHVATYRAIMFGPFWYVFWLGQLGLGAVVPLVLILNRRTNTTVSWLGAVGALIVMGILGVRLNIVIPPLTVPLMPGIDTAYPLGRFSTFTFAGFPQFLFRLLIVAFIVAFAVMIARLYRQAETPVQRGIGVLAGAGAFFAVVLVGLNLMDIGPTSQTVAALTTTRTTLPLYFGGQVRAQDATFYSPSLIEWLTSTGVIAWATLIFSLGKLFLPLEAEQPEPTLPPRRLSGFDTVS